LDQATLVISLFSINLSIKNYFSQTRDIEVVKTTIRKFGKLLGDKKKILEDFTFPVVAFTTGEQFNNALKDFLGDADITVSFIQSVCDVIIVILGDIMSNVCSFSSLLMFRTVGSNSLRPQQTWHHRQSGFMMKGV